MASKSRELKKIEEREIDILRNAVDKIESRTGKKVAQSPEIKKIIGRLERFLREKKLVCYGGTAINAILPEKYRFYNNDIEVPDYDFYSPNAMEDSKELADIFFNMGYNEVESKSGSHPGTFKVFVNFTPIADITHMEVSLFNVLAAKSYIKHGIRYAPTNFLRMAMYLELSRPEGDVSRWEKVLKRLTLLNKVYPMKLVNCSRLIENASNEREEPDSKDKDKEHRNTDNYEDGNGDGDGDNSARSVNSSESSMHPKSKSDDAISIRKKQLQRKIYDVTQKVLMNSNIVFIGGFADILYSKYLPKNERHKLTKSREFDVLSNNPQELANLIMLTLKTNGFDNIVVEKLPPIGEIILDHYKVAVGNHIIVLIYKPTACHSYNTIKLNNQIIKVASIDTMMMFYLAFSYARRYYYNRDRLLCLAGILFYIQNKNRLIQTGLLKRFGSSCYGVQETLESIRRDKANKYLELKGDKTNPEYQKLFLRYVPFERARTRVRNIRKNRSILKRKKISVRNEMFDPISVKPEVDVVRGVDDSVNGKKYSSSNNSPLTYVANSQVLSKLKTKTVSKPSKSQKKTNSTTKTKKRRFLH